MPLAEIEDIEDDPLRGRVDYDGWLDPGAAIAGACSVTTSQRCVTDGQCPTDETCDGVPRLESRIVWPHPVVRDGQPPVPTLSAAGDVVVEGTAEAVGGIRQVELRVEDGTAVLRLPAFHDGTPANVRASLDVLAGGGSLEGLEDGGELLLDLRGVAGGDEAAAYQVAALFTAGDLGVLEARGEVTPGEDRGDASRARRPASGACGRWPRSSRGGPRSRHKRAPRSGRAS